MSGNPKQDRPKPPKKGTTSKPKPQPSAPQPMQCHICQCPLFQPRPTCTFCKKGACSDHLRKLRKYPHKQSSKKSQSKPNMQPICDECQDEYLVQKAMELPEFTEELKVITEIEVGLEKGEKEGKQKAEEIRGRLQAKELKWGSVRMREVGFDVGARVQEISEIEGQIGRDEEELDQHTRLVEAAAVELDALEAEPFMSFDQDIKILQLESGRLTKQLLKLDKNLVDLQQSIKKIESEMLESYDKWEKSEVEKKKRREAQQDKNCVLF